MYVEKFYPRYSDGTPMGIGDELEVSYPDLHGIPHRGLVYRLIEGPDGVDAIEIGCLFDRFSQFRLRLSRRLDGHVRGGLRLHVLSIGRSSFAISGSAAETAARRRRRPSGP